MKCKCGKTYEGDGVKTVLHCPDTKLSQESIEARYPDGHAIPCYEFGDFAGFSYVVIRPLGAEAWGKEVKRARTPYELIEITQKLLDEGVTGAELGSPDRPEIYNGIFSLGDTAGLLRPHKRALKEVRV